MVYGASFCGPLLDVSILNLSLEPALSTFTILQRSVCLSVSVSSRTAWLGDALRHRERRWGEGREQQLYDAEEAMLSAPRTSSRLQLKLNQGVHIRFWPKHWNSCVTLCFHVQCVIKGSTNVDARWERLALCLRSRNLHSCTKTSRPQWHYLEALRQQEARDSAGFSETVSQRFPAIAAKSTSSHHGTK